MKAGEFERDTYVDGLAYLLRGLPENLTPQEGDRLLRSMPAALLDGTENSRSIASRDERHPSTLYRLTNSIALRFILLLSILLPYLLLLVQWLAGLERRYKVSENLSCYALQMMNAVAHHGGRVLQATSGQEWRIGQLLISRLLWTVEEVSRGLADGVDQGLSGMRAQQLR